MALQTGPFVDQGEGTGGRDRDHPSGSDGRGQAAADVHHGVDADQADPGEPDGLVARTRRWLERPLPIVTAASPLVRRLGVLWVCVSLPVIAAASGFVVDSRD